MQNTKTIPLDENRAVTVRELRVRDVRRLISSFSNLANADVKALLTDQFTELSELMGTLLIMPAGETIEDLTGSEVEAVISGMVEVNKPFLALAGLDHLAVMLSPGSTENAAGLSSAATPAYSTTAGDSSLLQPADPTDEDVNETDSGNQGDNDQ